MTFAARYRAANEAAHVRCSIEAGTFGKLADNECKCGRLAGDSTPACGCWPGEEQPVAVVVELWSVREHEEWRQARIARERATRIARAAS